MKSLALFALLMSLGLARAAEIGVTDATPAFWKFWTEAAGKPEERRVRMFFDVFVAAHPELFDEGVMDGRALTGKLPAKDRQSIVAGFLRDVTPYIQRMKEVSASIGGDFRAFARDFENTFPDFRPRSQVFITVSLFSFDGGTRTVGGKTALVFGIDGIARYHQPGESLKVFFDHELFHQYHDQVVPEPGDDDAPLWTQMWEEGLATFISQQMNPGATEAQALMSATLGAAAEPMLPALAQELRKNADSLDKDEYAAFFYGKNSRPDLPPRCGYYVGYRVAKILGAGRTLHEFALLHGPELKVAAMAALDELAKEPRPSQQR